MSGRPPSAVAAGPRRLARLRRALPLPSGLILSALFLWLALRETDVAELSEALAGAALWPLPLCAVALVACYWLKAERWRLLIRAEHGARASRLVDPMMMGFAANNVFPLRVGELVRVYVAGRVLGMPKTQVLASLVVERALDVLSVAVLTGSALLLIQLRAVGDAQDPRLLLAALAAVLASLAGLTLLRALVGRDLAPLARVAPRRLRAPLETLLGQFAAGLEPLAARRRALPLLSGSLLQWLLVALCVHLSVVAVGAEPRSLPAATIVLGLVVLGISLPSGPAYVGTIEYAFVLGLGFFAVTPAAALAAAIYYHVFMFVSVTSAGAICWARYALAERRERAASGPVG